MQKKEVKKRIRSVRTEDGQLHLELSVLTDGANGGLVEELVVSPDALIKTATKPRATEVQKAWGLEIAGYLYLGGLGAGAFIVAVVLDWFGVHLSPTLASPLGDWAWDWGKVFVLWGPVVTALGAALLILHLGRNWFLFFTACLNPRSSWLARGFLILFSFIILGCAVAASAVLFPSFRSETIVLWRVVEALGVACAFGTAIYTGILVKSMKFIPAWNSPFMPFLFLASALSTGSMGVVVGSLIYRFLAPEAASAHEIIHTLDYVEPVVLAAEAALLYSYVRHLLKGKPEGVLSARMFLSGSWRYAFWVGIVGMALALPFVLALVNLGLRLDALALLAGLSVLAGGFILRLGILGVGVKEEAPLYRKSEWLVQHLLTGPEAVPPTRVASEA